MKYRIHEVKEYENKRIDSQIGSFNSSQEAVNEVLKKMINKQDSFKWDYEDFDPDTGSSDWIYAVGKNNNVTLIYWIEPVHNEV